MRIALIGMGRMGRMIETAPQTAASKLRPNSIRRRSLSSPSATVWMPSLIFRSGVAAGTRGLCAAHRNAARFRHHRLLRRRSCPRQCVGQLRAMAVSASFSIGVAVLKHLAAEAAALLPDFDIEIIETHHRMKKMRRAARRSSFFQPSTPTAPIRRSSAAKDSHPAQPVKSVSTLSAAAPWRACIPCPSSATKKSSLTHRAESRRIFAIGALKTAEKLKDAPVGLHTLDELLFARR